MLNSGRLLLPILILFFIQSCANYKLNYSAEAKDWKEASSPADSVAIDYTVYLIGDAGNGSADWQPPALKALGEALNEAPENSAVVFLGDNLYPNGMPSKGAVEERALDEIHLNHQMDILEGFSGRSFFVAGNHDWYEHGVEGVRRQANYIEKYTDGNTVLLPKPGCGDPVEIELTESITLLLLDSQWWLSDWENEPKINEGCEAKSRADFAYMLREAIKSNQRKEILIALHHPPFSAGHHGGNFPFVDHIFPLRDISDNLYVPLPVIGSFFRFLQASIGSRQDVANASYRDLRRLLIQEAHITDSIIFASGHEHTIQHWERDNNYFIVSGSGSKQTAAKTGAKGNLFAYGGYGYSQVDYYANGEVWVSYFQTPDGGEPALAFRRLLKISTATVEEVKHDHPDDFAENRVRTIPVSSKDFSRTRAGEAIWGQHYREAYSSSVTVPDIDLAAEGLFPKKRGGGFQTNSLRLENEEGKQYTLRSIDKDASRTVPYPLNTDLVLGVVEDNFSASHPLAALAVAPLAELAGIYHTNPSLVYLPEQNALGEYNEDYANSLYLFEERPDNEHWQEADRFGNPDWVVSTFEMLEETRGHHENRIDQEWVIRSRLFDIIIGDWDRHDDQWRWARIERNGNNYYRPIPRDRDQAFANYDGPAIGLARILSAKSKQWRPFTNELGKVHWATYNGHLFDQSFLTELEWKDWEVAIEHLQTEITDAGVDSVFEEAWPEPFLSRDGPPIKETIKDRRDNLREIAREYYLHLADGVDVLGTDKKDLVLVERLNDEQTKVSVYDSNSDGELESLLYERIFLTKETSEIRCYGLEGDDIFRVRGTTHNGIVVHLIGGEGEDSFDDASFTSRVGSRVIIHDFTSENNEIIAASDTRDERDDRASHNLYNRRSKAYDYNFNLLTPLVGFNPDDKFFMGFRGTYTTYGFRKEPYDTKHKYGAQVSLSTGGTRLFYSIDKKNVFNRWGIRFGTVLQTPLYAINYYGLGNVSENRKEDVEDDYYRLRQQEFEISTALVWEPSDQFEVYIGQKITHFKIERSENRFIDEIGDELDEDIFDGANFLSLDAGLIFRNVDQNIFPTRGMGFKSHAGYYYEFKDEDGYRFPYFDAELSLYQNLDTKGKLIFATRLGMKHLFSDNFPFYLGATLGGLGENGNIRGFNRNRFTGESAYYHNTDLRLKLTYWSNPILPMTIGITGSFDYGRVSVEDEISKSWHHSYGGGVFLSPFDLLTLHFGGYQSQDDFQFLFAGGFFF